ncbi:hypothetical protein KAI92_03650 [Candidatus Parcubacteria bacterium]|nr:hypothetical protein [Candidatus Parcubacteria bacterium]
MKLFKFFIFILLITPFFSLSANNSSEKVAGLVLLQVEDLGQLWYVNPKNLEKYYLKNNEDVFRLIKHTGLGVANKTFESFNGFAPKRLAGVILLKVEEHGEAYYVNPRTLSIQFLGNQNNFFHTFANISIGATNEIINPIKINQDFTISTNIIIKEPEELIEEESELIIEEEDETGEIITEEIDEEVIATSSEEVLEETSTTTEQCVFLEEFFGNQKLIGSPTATSTSTTINYDWKLGSPENLNFSNKFSARWTANCYFEEGRYNFNVSFDDAVKVYLDGVNFISNWKDNARTVNFNRERNITEGYHKVKLEYYDASGLANIDFSWNKIGESSY